MRIDRVGVTGHRWWRLDRAKSPFLAHELSAVFRQIEGNSFGSITMVCGMAEGTDILAAAQKPQEWGLEAVLPLPLADWRVHLAEQPGVGDADLYQFENLILSANVISVVSADSTPGYVALARYIAESCDIVVAVWDGQDGKPGGTADVVHRSLVLERDVRIIDAKPFLIAAAARIGE